MDGEVLHLRLYDVGAEIDLARVRRVLGQEPLPAPLLASSPTPPYASFPRPLEARLQPPPGGGAGTLEARLHGDGVVALRLRLPFSGADLESLQRGRHPACDGAAAGRVLDAALEGIRQELATALREPYSATTVEPEPYRIYCLTGAGDQTAALLQGERHRLGLLAAGETGENLVPERLESALRHTLRYKEQDAAILGWDNAVVLGHPGSYEDVLDVLELANLELLEFRTYDALLDQRLDESFAALDRLWARGGLFRSARSALEDISRLRVDFARLTDRLHDTGKLFGDWYLAQVHHRLSDRFHIPSWERAVRSKMETLEDMYHLAQEETNHRRSVVLEALIVALFVLDLALLVFGRR